MRYSGGYTCSSSAIKLFWKVGGAWEGGGQWVRYGGGYTGSGSAIKLFWQVCGGGGCVCGGLTA